MQYFERPMQHWYIQSWPRSRRVGIGRGLMRLAGRISVVLALVWASCLRASAGTEDTLHIQATATEFFLDDNYYSILEDPSGRLALADVRSPALGRRFTALRGSGQPPNIQRTRSAYWLRITVRHHRTENSTWYLKLYDSHEKTFFTSPVPGFCHDARGRVMLVVS